MISATCSFVRSSDPNAGRAAVPFWCHWSDCWTKARPGAFSSFRVFSLLGFICAIQQSICFPWYHTISWVGTDPYEPSSPTLGSTWDHPKFKLHVWECYLNAPWTSAAQGHDLCSAGPIPGPISLHWLQMNMWWLAEEMPAIWRANGAQRGSQLKSLCFQMLRLTVVSVPRLWGIPQQYLLFHCPYSMLRCLKKTQALIPNKFTE